MASAPTSTSLLGIIRARTGLDFDLPTEWQWEYAMRAGSGDVRPSWATIMYRRNTTDGRNSPETEGSCYVDRGNPNPWGFYCVYGNVWDHCINGRDDTNWITKDGEYTDPQGGGTRKRHKGIGWSWGYGSNTYWDQFGPFAATTDAVDTAQGFGVRLFLQVQ